MRTTKRLLCMLIALVMVFTLGVAAFASSEEAAEVDIYASLSLEDAAWTLDEQNGVWSLTNVTYCLDPVSDLEYLNIFVPEEYMDEDGQFTDEVINGYDADTAPVILANDVGGYAESRPFSAGSAAQYTSRGYVVVSPGTRGRDTVNEDGEYIGRGCAGLADLKAAVRFIKYNDAYIPGNVDHIVSVGKSAGGGLSALLATTGNNSAYDPYLQDIGAIMTETDDIYAAQVYCPGTDTEHANLSYEWFYHDSLSYESEEFPGPTASASSEPGVLSEYQQALSDDLALLFVDYVNELDLTDENGGPLTLDGLREGSYYDYFLGKLESALEAYLAETYPASEDPACLDEDAIDAYINDLNAESEWVTAEFTYDGDQAVAVSVTMTSLTDYTTYYWTRQTAVPAYDETSYGDSYTELFGDEDGTSKHYDPYLTELMTSGKYEGMEGYDSSYTEDYLNVTELDTALMNPITMMEGSDIASYVRIRTGTEDVFSTFADSVNLALAIECRSDAEVDQEFAWGQPHGEAEINSEDLYTWIDQVCGADA